MTPFRYLGIFGATCIALYLLLLAASYLIYPPLTDGAIDTAQAPNTLYATEPKYLLFNIHVLSAPKPRVVLIGSSNVREGLRPKQLQRLLGNVEIDNLAIGAANVHELAQVVKLVYGQIPPRAAPQTIFVIGIWYGLFVGSESRWPNGMTDLNVEQLRYGLYRRSAGYRVEARIPALIMPVAEVALRPLLLVSRFYDEAIVRPMDNVRLTFARLVGEAPFNLQINDPETFVLNPAERTASLTFWRQYMGTNNKWSNEFHELVEVAKLISSNHGRLVVLDLPLPSWHREAIPQYQFYETHKQEVLEKLQQIPGVTYASLESGFMDNQFYDSAHPRPKYTWRWAQRAAVPIEKAYEQIRPPANVSPRCNRAFPECADAR